MNQAVTLSTQRPIDLLLVSALFPPLYTGAGLQAEAVLQRLTGEVRVRLLTLGVPGSPRQEERNGWSIERIGSSGSRRPVRDFGGAVLRRLPLLQPRPDLIWCLGVGPATYAAILIGRARGIPVVVKLTLEGQDDPATLRSASAGRFRLRCLRSASLICPSERLRQIALEAGLPPDQVHYIPNGVDLGRFVPGANRIAGQMVFAGAITERKGLHLAVAALRALGEEYPSARLLVLGEPRPVPEAGEAEYVRRLRAEVESEPLSSRVEMLGLVERPEALLVRSSIFVLPSSAEGLPNALLEAMAAGVVPIASDLPTIREVVSPGVEGVLVSERTTTDWTEALRSLLGDASAVARMSKAARTKVEQRFDLTKTAQEHLRLFRNLSATTRDRGRS